jgi:hypothetical protein
MSLVLLERDGTIEGLELGSLSCADVVSGGYAEASFALLLLVAVRVTTLPLIRLPTLEYNIY